PRYGNVAHVLVPSDLLIHANGIFSARACGPEPLRYLSIAPRVGSAPRATRDRLPSGPTRGPAPAL
ncbi:hypothetical protein, partial [Cognatishimia sp.]|uniref:hypothetical protein n=1 Tax=Cognatishimia sp. TaxID=2211648 RepID=UPI0035158B4F